MKKKWILVPMFLLLPCFAQAADDAPAATPAPAAAPALPPWWTGEIQEDGKTISVGALSGLPDADTRAKHVWAANIIWTYTPQPNGKPTPEDAAQMSTFEGEVEKQLEEGGSAIKAIVRTSDTTRQWTYYVADLSQAQTVLSKELGQFKSAKIETRFRPDSQWIALTDVLKKRKDK